MHRSRLLWAIAIGLLVALPAQAQSRGGSSPAAQFRFGGFFPAGDSEFWDESEEVFTLETSDFQDFSFGLTFVAPLSDHFEIGFNFDFYDAKTTSGYRGFVDQDGFEILHDTKLDVVPMIVDLRWLPGGRGAVRGRHGQYRVRKPAFWLGGGIGTAYWEYEESGDFLDFGFDPPEIFTDRFKEEGFAFATEALAGIEFPLGNRWGFLVEGRYLWADDEFTEDFEGLGEIDLGGLFVYGGFSVKF